MPIRILHNALELCTYLNQLDLELTNPQRKNILNITDVLLTCKDEKTLAELWRQFLAAPDASNWEVYVQFDSWYASEKLIKYVRRQGWQVACGLKSNRKLSGVRIDQLGHALRHKRYTHVPVTAADGKPRTCYVREITGRLQKVPDPVHVFLSRRHPRENPPVYFMSTALTRLVQQASQGYCRRWPCEVVNFYLKTQLGLADFRVRSYLAIGRYMLVVLLAWTYVEQHYETERSPQVKT